MSYQAALNAFDAQIVNARNYAMRTRSLPTLTEDTASLLVEAARRATSRLSALTVHHFHGAAARIPVAHTAFATRRDHLLIEIRAAWEPHQAANRATHQQWVDTLSEQLAPHAWSGGHTNVLGPDEHDRSIFGYGLNAQRLRRLKARYDPDGMFTPAAGALKVA